MLSAKVIEALKNVTQSRGYTAAEEATAKQKLAQYAPAPKQEFVVNTERRKASFVDCTFTFGTVFPEWKQGFYENKMGWPTAQDSKKANNSWWSGGIYGKPLRYLF